MSVVVCVFSWKLVEVMSINCVLTFYCSVSLVCIFFDVCPTYHSGQLSTVKHIDGVLFVRCMCLSLFLVKLDPSLFVGLCAKSMLNG